MQLSDFITGGKINSINFKVFVKPFLVMLFIFILFIFLLNSGVAKIKLQIANYDSSRKTEEMLATKLAILTEGSKIALENSNKLVIALPEKNSVMVMISQLKRLAPEKDITIGKLEISGLRTENNLNSIELQVDFNVNGLFSLVEFLKELPNMAPVSSVFAVKINDIEGGKFTGKMDILVYWSDFPATIPGVREPTVNLSESEMAALQLISKLREPEYQILESTGETDRAEPFN